LSGTNTTSFGEGSSVWSLLPFEFRVILTVLFVLLALTFLYLIKKSFRKKKPTGMNVRTWRQRREERNKRNDEWARAYGLGDARVDTNALINKMKIILGLVQIVREGSSLSQVPWPPIVKEIQEKYSVVNLDPSAIFNLPGMACLASFTYLVRVTICCIF
jgi:hypothetical protein